MLTAVEMKSISNAVVNNTSINPTLISETSPSGNIIIDELQHAGTWAARAGNYAAYLAISKFPLNLVDNAVDVLVGLGYTVDETRLRFYNEIMFSWETV